MKKLYRYNCGNCTDPYETTEIESKYCSRSCAAIANNKKRVVKKSTKAKIRAGVIKHQKLNPHPNFWLIEYHNCSICTSLFITRASGKLKRKACSKQCLTVLRSQAGRKSAAKQIKRSNDEIQLFNLCKEHFSNVSHNQIIIDGWDADILLNDHKIAILWNGPWHYREMPGLKHSLIQTQNRDKMKLRKFTSIGWSLLIFNDNMFTPDKAFDVVCQVIK